MEEAKSAGVRVYCIDKLLKEILKTWDHQKLVRTTNLRKEGMEVLQRQLDAVGGRVEPSQG